MEWEPVIGLEIHAQLNTKSKLFSSAHNHFGDEPNVNITEVCTGQPGALPVPNEAAVDKAVLFGCAINATISLLSTFDRKSYFYPDSPRNFQITQFENPILLGGQLEADVDGIRKQFTIHHTHLEDDAGMLKHFSTFAGVDYNRAGAALIEIVSDPCLHSAKEASAYASAIRDILHYLDISDCNMEEGSFRMDCNVSVRKKGEKKLRGKIEIKNLNSFHYMELAIESEILRQIRLYEEDSSFLMPPSTYRFDTGIGKTVLMRQKEDAEDYRYFPEPDLPPLFLTQDHVEAIRATLPELPQKRKERFLSQLGLPLANTQILVGDKALADYFETALKSCSDAKSLANWILVEFVGRLKEKGQSLLTSPISPAHVGELLSLIEKGIITGKIAKSVADDMVASPGKNPSEIVQANPDYQPVHDTAEIEPMVDQVLRDNAESVADFKAGKAKAFSYLVGQVMKLCKGKASPAIVNDLLKQKLQ